MNHFRAQHVGIAMAAGVFLTAALARAQPDGKEKPTVLFDGRLDGWVMENATGANFSVREGVLRVQAAQGWLRSVEQYGDFRLRLEFRFLTDDADSGIFVRTSGAATFGRGWPNRGYQVQLRNPVGRSPLPPVGGIFRHGMPAGPVKFDPTEAARLSLGTGKWQTLEIEAMGDRLRVWLNATLLTEAEGIQNPSGYIGIQAETGAIEFRAISISTR